VSTHFRCAHGQESELSDQWALIQTEKAHPTKNVSYLGVVMSSEADSTMNRERLTRSLDPLWNQLLRTSPRRDMKRFSLDHGFLLASNPIDQIVTELSCQLAFLPLRTPDHSEDPPDINSWVCRGIDDIPVMTDPLPAENREVDLNFLVPLTGVGLLSFSGNREPTDNPMSTCNSFRHSTGTLICLLAIALQCTVSGCNAA